jgi:hypothetical protein
LVSCSRAEVSDALCRTAAFGICQCVLDTFNAMQLVDHRVTWQEFTTAFHEYYIPAGVLNRKLESNIQVQHCFPEPTFDL